MAAISSGSEIVYSAGRYSERSDRRSTTTSDVVAALLGRGEGKPVTSPSSSEGHAVDDISAAPDGMIEADLLYIPHYDGESRISRYGR